MTQTLKTSERLGVVDALRGFALLAIVLLHNHLSDIEERNCNRRTAGND